MVRSPAARWAAAAAGSARSCATAGVIFSGVQLPRKNSGTARVSVTADRAKTRNAARDPRVSLHVSATDFWSYAVIEGDAELSAVATDPHDAAADELVEVFRQAAGKEHDDWEDFRRAMVSERRQVLRVRATNVYGMAQLP